VSREPGLLVRGGNVLDGTGSPARRADVRVHAGAIVEVGPDLVPDGEAVLDATGCSVAPGFVDLHTHFDPSMWWDPTLDPMAAHGVTTVVTGNCSLSLAPLRAEQRSGFADVFAYIEDIPVAAFEQSVPWSWQDWPSYRAALGTLELGVNVAPLVGHSALRLFALGDAADRPAGPAQRSRVVGALDDALRNGAFGLSVSFGDTDRHGTPVPSRAADDDELSALVAALARRGRLLQFVPYFNDYGHGRFVADIDRVGRLVAGTGVTATYAPLFAPSSAPGVASALLGQALALQSGGSRVVPQVSPRPLELMVNFGNTMLFAGARAWHDAANGDPAAARPLLADPAWRDQARADWDAGGYEEGIGAGLVVATPPAGRDEIAGLTIGALAARSGRHGSDVLAELLLASDLGVGLAVTVGNDDPATVAGMINHPATVVGASDAGAHLQMQCGSGDSTLLLTRHVRDRGDLALEAAVHALTGAAADLLGLRDRGRLAPGLAADLVVFDLDELAYRSPAPVADVPPHATVRLTRPPAGLRATVIGGAVVHTEGRDGGARPGRVLDATSGRT